MQQQLLSVFIFCLTYFYIDAHFKLNSEKRKKETIALKDKMIRGRFPFNKNSGFKFRKLHVLKGTVHYGCTVPTQATARFVLVASQQTQNYTLKEKSNTVYIVKNTRLSKRGGGKLKAEGRNPISRRKPMKASEGKKFS